MWLYYLVSADGVSQQFKLIDSLMKYCDTHRGQYTEYIVSVSCIHYKNAEALPDLNDPGLRLGYNLDT